MSHEYEHLKNVMSIRLPKLFEMNNLADSNNFQLNHANLQLCTETERKLVWSPRVNKYLPVAVISGFEVRPAEPLHQ